ncbi:hypothetical protein [Poseidonibacter ostreae]|uniref:Uncharacterized protein n=1 Tax=Poseidonibacter ostreae TaxID=2654171 RepID=A0A6L4WX07_9BACT|nr:hypothetical protein [Poseidonibacter ostreae]KAB7891411.1 hypothetical protein GBG19_00815 [Poseidonibacter ostreae]
MKQENEAEANIERAKKEFLDYIPSAFVEHIKNPRFVKADGARVLDIKSVLIEKANIKLTKLSFYFHGGYPEMLKFENIDVSHESMGSLPVYVNYANVHFTLDNQEIIDKVVDEINSNDLGLIARYSFEDKIFTIQVEE